MTKLISKGTQTSLRVGQLARRTGLSVRTLHYYDEIGLLIPPRRAESGYRLYGEPEIVRLQQIASLRQLGFGLDEIREILTRPGTSVEGVIELHLERINVQIEEMQRLRDRLAVIARGLRTNGSVTAEALLETMEAMKRMEKYYTPEQLETLRRRHEELGEEHIKEVEAEWPALIAKVQAEYDAGTDPSRSEGAGAGRSLDGADPRVHRRRPGHRQGRRPHLAGGVGRSRLRDRPNARTDRLRP